MNDLKLISWRLIKQNKTYYNFGENFEYKELKNKLQLGKENYCH